MHQQFSSRLCVITDRYLAGLPHDEIIRQMLLGGARLIQLRDKNTSQSQLLDTAQACLKLTRAFGAHLIINDCVDIALAANVDGVHLGQKDIPVEEARARLGPYKIIGLSTHSLDQFRAGLMTSADYLAIGPIYPTTTKEDHEPVVGLDLIRAARALTERPIVAIGGITLERAPEVITAGADMIAVISALYQTSNLHQSTRAYNISARVRAFLDTLST